MKKLIKELSTVQMKVDKVYSGSVTVKNVEIPQDEEFNSTCALLPSLFYDTPLTKEDLSKMNTESAPTDVFKPFRAEATESDSVQVERFSKMRNKVVESLSLSIPSRRMPLSISPSRKRGKDMPRNNP